MPFKAGEIARAKHQHWASNYAGRLFLILDALDVCKDESDLVLRDAMGATGNKYILLDCISGGVLHAYDSELEELE